MKPIINLDVVTVREKLAAGAILLVDVREAHEFAARRIEGAVNVPLSTFDPSQLPDAGERDVVFMCAGGVRSKNALDQCMAAGLPWDQHLAGEIQAWAAAGALIA